MCLIAPNLTFDWNFPRSLCCFHLCRSPKGWMLCSFCHCLAQARDFACIIPHDTGIGASIRGRHPSVSVSSPPHVENASVYFPTGPFFGALCQCLLNQFQLSHSENSRINGFPYCVLIAALRPGRSTRPNERAAELEFGSNTIATKSLDSRERIREEEGKRDRKEES